MTTSWLTRPALIVVLRPFRRQPQRAVLKLMMMGLLVLVAIVEGRVREEEEEEEEEEQVSRLEGSRIPTTNSFQPKPLPKPSRQPL